MADETVGKDRFHHADKKRIKDYLLDRRVFSALACAIPDYSRRKTVKSGCLKVFWFLYLLI